MRITTDKATNTARIHSSLTPKELEILKKGNPAALQIVELKGETEVVKGQVSYSPSEYGSFSAIGGCAAIRFNSIDRDGKLVCVVRFDEKKTDEATKAALSELVLPVQATVEAIEATAAQAVKDLLDAQAALAKDIVIG